MDLGRPASMTFATPVLDHDLLIAGIAVRQASTTTAALAQRLGDPVGQGDVRLALVAVLAGQESGATSALGGSFHPRVAKASAEKARSILMKAGFTLAF